MNNDIKDSGLWVDVKTETGFILNVNLRRDTLEEAMTELKKFITKNKLTPYERYQSKGYPQKVVEYVPDRVCPKCGNKLIYAKKQDGTKFIKCETNKWNKMLKKAEGCEYVDWGDSKLKKQVDDSFAEQKEQEESEDINF